MRADQLLVTRGLATTRSQAQRLIAAGARWHDGARWKPVTKNGDELPPHAQLELLDTAESRYVSRGGLKLEAVLNDAAFNVAGLQCLDVGQSTGGFTDCLLQQGAVHVVGVDVGHGQLHPHLRADARVTCVENINARYLNTTDLIAALAGATGSGSTFGLNFQGFDLIVGDLSFISLTLVLPALTPLLKPTSALLMLVKPQFELQPAHIGKGGLVKDPASYAQVEQRIRTCCSDLDLQVTGWYDSAIAGGDGNREFFVYARQAANDK
mgnify:CR=1 FL=1